MAVTREIPGWIAKLGVFANVLLLAVFVVIATYSTTELAARLAAKAFFEQRIAELGKELGDIALRQSADSERGSGFATAVADLNQRETDIVLLRQSLLALEFAGAQNPGDTVYALQSQYESMSSRYERDRQIAALEVEIREIEREITHRKSELNFVERAFRKKGIEIKPQRRATIRERAPVVSQPLFICDGVVVDGVCTKNSDVDTGKPTAAVDGDDDFVAGGTENFELSDVDLEWLVWTGKVDLEIDAARVEQQLDQLRASSGSSHSTSAMLLNLVIEEVWDIQESIFSMQANSNASLSSNFTEVLTVSRGDSSMGGFRMALLDAKEFSDGLLTFHSLETDAVQSAEEQADRLQFNLQMLKDNRFEQFASPLWSGYFPFLFALSNLPSDLLIAIVVVSCGIIGSLFAGMRSGTLSPYMRVPFGAVAGFVAFLLIKGGKHFFFVPISPDSFPVNPYAAAFAGVLAGLFTERAYLLLENVFNSFAQNIEGKAASKAEESQ